MEKMTYRDYLILTAATAAKALADAIESAVSMTTDEYAIRHLEQKLDVARVLTQYHYNSERVEARPDIGD